MKVVNKVLNGVLGQLFTCARSLEKRRYKMKR